MAYFVQLLTCVVCLLCSVPGANAQERFALLIANFEYSKDVGPLRNTKRDVDLVASALKQIGFSDSNIRREQNASREDMRRYVREHVERVKQAGPGAISFFYYSGHGVSPPPGSPARVKGDNYLIPTDVANTRTADFWDKAVPLDEVGETFSQANLATHILVFDACRTELQLPDRSARRGFVPISNSDYVGILFAFSSSPGQPAFDSLDDDAVNGPYAKALAEEIISPGTDHLHLFANVRTRVANDSRRQQIPWIRDGFLTLVYLSPRNESGKSDGDGSARQAPRCVAPAPKLASIDWESLSSKHKLLFKRPTLTYVAARTDSGFVEQVDKDEVHRVAQGSSLEVGRINGKIAWYRYLRDIGSPLTRYVAASDALPY